MIHDPYDFPDDNTETKSISTKTLSFLTVYPETTYSTNDVRNLLPDIRYCYYSDEHKLNYMQRYSYLNCLAECRTEIIYRLCKCVPYNLPNNGSYRICNLNEMSCVRMHRTEYMGALPGYNRTKVLASEASIHYRPCNCLPDCQFHSYPTEITSAILNRTFSHSRPAL